VISETVGQLSKNL